VASRCARPNDCGEAKANTTSREAQGSVVKVRAETPRDRKGKLIAPSGVFLEGRVKSELEVWRSPFLCHVADATDRSDVRCLTDRVG
jgi:hypothetical protein